MSALTDLFTAMANKIRSKTGTATTYTPLEMVSDGIDDVYAAGYDAGGGGATGIPITPSNASPVSLTSGESYEMLANGYAVSSYTNATPSNSSPVALSNDTIYKTGGAGYAIESYQNITPNANATYLYNNKIYKMGGAGYVTSNIVQITPSRTGEYFSAGAIVAMLTNGYAYNQRPSLTQYAMSDQIYAAASSTNGEVAHTWTVTDNTSGKFLVIVSGTTNCSSNQGYMGICLNGVQKNSTDYWKTSANGTSLRISSTAAVFNASTNDVITITKNWSGSHTGVYWTYTYAIYSLR